MNMMTTITALDVREIEDEGRILDTDLGAALGMARGRTIRDIIRNHKDVLEQLGGLPCETANPGPKGGRPAA